MSIIFRKDDLVNKAELEERLWELQGYVTRYLRTFDLGEGLLDDAVQETMINAWMHIDQLRDVSRMKWWVRSIAMNVGLKYVKKIKQKLSREISLETRLENVASEEEEAMLCQALSEYVEKADLGRVEELLSCLGKESPPPPPPPLFNTPLPSTKNRQKTQKLLSFFFFFFIVINLN